VHELNVDAVIDSFLPYHDSPQFARMLAIIRLESTHKSPYFSLLHPLQKSPQTLDRSLLIRYMSPAKDKSLFVLQRILALVPKAAEEDAIHRTLLNFWGAILVEFLEKIRGEGGVPENVVKALVEGFVRSLIVERGGADFAVSQSIP
jgi:U3 small nucleolar RNA-associated protein 10